MRRPDRDSTNDAPVPQRMSPFISKTDHGRQIEHEPASRINAERRSVFLSLLVAAIMWTIDWGKRGLIGDLSAIDAKSEMEHSNIVRNDIREVYQKIREIHLKNQRLE